MNRMIVHSKVDPDGVLRLAVPIGTVEANRELQITIESASVSGGTMTDYETWLDGIVGKWQGEFERMPTSELESRDPL